MNSIKYLVNNKDENIMIFELKSKISNIFSQEFFEIFQDRKDLTVNKTTEIFEYFLNLIFNEIKEDIEENKLEFDYKNLKDKLKKYFTSCGGNGIYSQKIINKYNLASALRLFMSLVLFREEDKVNKIKANKKNLINYLNVEDFWQIEIFSNNKFNYELSELKQFNLQTKNIVWLYDYLVEEEKEDFYNDEEEEEHDETESEEDFDYDED